ncbi:PspC domain-containing protein [Bifidobacterium xylocopae]|uniref:Phage shock protein PspC N-terminal domain-containing protein n=1 Tax=Bifidobacterium xylocopae TaxID=2493119 RepID=A0A366KF84_9BIFI|nr:PspC domain-containing protein [Bifidobacterium xylocopae]RBP99773.1 hypothetical protein CRD59_01670 [Bifidobacterium xylocopae]
MNDFNQRADPYQGPASQGAPGRSYGQGGQAGPFPDHDQDPNMGGGYGPPYGPRRPVGGRTMDRFFRWVRGSYLRRSDNRWVGGICAGIAERLGWSTALVRVIMFVAGLSFGAGLAFYGFAWFILPDKRNTIIAEDLLAGSWRGAMVGIILFWLLSIGSGAIVVSPFIGAVLVWAFLAWSGEQARRYGWGYGQVASGGGPGPFADAGGPGTAPAGPAYTAQGAVPPSDGQGWSGPAPGPVHGQAKDGTAGSPADSAPDASGPRPGGPVPSDDSQADASGWSPGRASSTPASAQGTGARPGAAWQPDPYRSYGPHGSYGAGPGPTAYVAPMPPPSPARPRVRRMRRKPAGPVVVLVALGVMLLSGLAVWGLKDHPDRMISSSTLRAGLIWAGCLALAMGVLLVVLGAMGRRSGGLIPVAALTMLAVVGVGAVAVGSSVNRNGLRHELQGYETVNLGAHEHLELDAAPRQMNRYHRGVFLVGDRSAPATVTVDLSDYEENNGWHRVLMDDDSRQDSGCPTGSLRLASSAADVELILPKGCSYALVRQEVVNDLPTGGGHEDDFRDWIDHRVRLGLGRDYDGDDGGGVDGHQGHVSNPELDVRFTYASGSDLSVRREGEATLPRSGGSQPKDGFGRHHSHDREDEDDDD